MIGVRYEVGPENLLKFALKTKLMQELMNLRFIRSTKMSKFLSSLDRRFSKAWFCKLGGVRPTIKS